MTINRLQRMNKIIQMIKIDKERSCDESRSSFLCLIFKKETQNLQIQKLKNLEVTSMIHYEF